MNWFDYYLEEILLILLVVSTTLIVCDELGEQKAEKVLYLECIDSGYDKFQCHSMLHLNRG